MIIWIKIENGQAIRLEDNWSHGIYAAADSRQTLQTLASDKAIQKYVKESKFVHRVENLADYKATEVLELKMSDSRQAVALGITIEDIYYDSVRLYNVDVPAPQAYFYEHDLFPLAKCSVTEQHGTLVWKIHDSLWSTDYSLPDFRITEIDVKHAKQGALPASSDKIDTITITSGNETITIQNQSEQDVLQQLMDEVTRLDPDFIFTVDGDESIFPYLVTRATKNKMQLVLGRDNISVEEPKEGVTYFSYGKVHYRPASAILYGRIHFDRNNSFIFDHSSLHGLYELARLCRMPLHNCARATIGRCLSSMQYYQAFKRGLLVPWKPVNTERWKSFSQLFIADRGGLILEPVVGVHENVAEYDFAMLYPAIMTKRNVSGETINCQCCQDSTNIVSELGYRICDKRRGIVSQALELPLEKRAIYKQLKKAANDESKREIYDTRQSALKWIGVVSFGYLGHANSKFGLIDSHIAVCAIDREVLLKARNAIESKGFTCLHGIVDSLWVQKDKATETYAQLKDTIEQAAGYDVSFEGVYKWIVFLPSKNNDLAPVPNRYFGCFQDGTIKDRGIETRRRDTPLLFSKFQHEALDIMAKGNTVKEVIELMPKVRRLLEDYKERLKNRKVAIEELVFTKSLSKDSSEYSVNTVETASIHQLEDYGKLMRAGQSLQYVITNYYARNKPRAVPIELLNDSITFDAKRYVELLTRCCNSITEPFGYVASA